MLPSLLLHLQIRLSLSPLSNMLYTAFGASIASDLPLDPLPVSQVARPAVVFRHRLVSRLGVFPEGGSKYDSQRRRLCSTHQRDIVRIRVGDSIHFSLLFHQRLIACLCTQDAAQEHVRYWFLQKMLPAYLLLQGRVEMLHASAVQINNRVAAFTAPSGTGKSTLVHHFVAAGHALFADEHVVIPDGTNLALPTIPYLRPHRQIESLGEVATLFASEPLPLGCIYILVSADPADPVVLQKLSGSAAAVALCMRQQFDLRGLKDESSSGRLERFTRIADRVTVKRLYVPRDLNRLNEVMEVVRNDLI